MTRSWTLSWVTGDERPETRDERQEMFSGCRRSQSSRPVPLSHWGTRRSPPASMGGCSRCWMAFSVHQLRQYTTAYSSNVNRSVVPVESWPLAQPAWAFSAWIYLWRSSVASVLALTEPSLSTSAVLSAVRVDDLLFFSHFFHPWTLASPPSFTVSRIE